MAITYSFVDNISYGTEDVNAITKDLTGTGIAPFPTRDTYSTSDLNALTGALVSSGVSLNGCLCSKTDNTVNVSQGIIFFENGVRMNVDGDGYSIAVPENTAGYVYAYFNPSLQTGGITFSAALPQTGYYTQLAKISATGILTDTRSFARSKVATLGANAVLDTVLTPVTPPVVEAYDGISSYTLITKQVDADISKFNYAIVDNGVVYAIFDIAKNIFTVVALRSGNQWLSSGETNTNRLISGSSNTTLYMYVQDNKLITKQIGKYSYDCISGEFNVKLI